MNCEPLPGQLNKPLASYEDFIATLPPPADVPLLGAAAAEGRSTRARRGGAGVADADVADPKRRRMTRGAADE